MRHLSVFHSPQPSGLVAQLLADQYLSTNDSPQQLGIAPLWMPSLAGSSSQTGTMRKYRSVGLPILSWVEYDRSYLTPYRQEQCHHATFHSADFIIDRSPITICAVDRR